MSYPKTNWTDGENKYLLTDQLGNVIPGFENIKLLYTGTGGTPLSATNMNKIEGGIEGAYAEIDRLSYDIYAMLIEQYYLGNSSTSPSIEEAKTVFFDGFKDSTLINALSTGALNSALGGYVCALTSSLMSPISGVLNAFTAGSISWPSTSAKLYGSAPQAYDGTLTGINGVGIYSGGNYDSPGYNLGVKFDLGVSKLLIGAAIYQYCTKYSGSWTAGASYINVWAEDLTTQLGYFAASLGNGVLLSNADLSLPIPSRYLYVGINDGDDMYQLLTEIKAKVGEFVSSILLSNSQSLTFTTKGARVFISTKLPVGTSIVPKVIFDGVEAAGTLVSSRDDPALTGYTEYEYDFSGIGTTAQLKVQLNPTAALSPVIAKYGVYCY